MEWDFEPKLIIPNGDHYSEWITFPVPDGVWGQLAPNPVQSSELPLTVSWVMPRAPFPCWFGWEVSTSGAGSYPLSITTYFDR